MKSGDFPVILLSAVSLVSLLINVWVLYDKYEAVKEAEYKLYHGFIQDDPKLDHLPGKIESVAMTVQPTTKFSLIDDRAWASILPGKRGFVRLGPKGRPWAMGLYHQLHCVNAIRFSYTVARDGLITDEQKLMKKIPHDNHCFQFLRQSITCQADETDVTVDMGGLEDEVKKRGLDEKGEWGRRVVKAGFGVQHRCRNFEKIREFVLENDKTWEGVPFDTSEGTVAGKNTAH